MRPLDLRVALAETCRRMGCSAVAMEEFEKRQDETHTAASRYHDRLPYLERHWQEVRRRIRAGVRG